MKTIRELRIERGWSQGYLADQAGISLQTVFRIEQGNHPVHALVRDALCRALDVNPGEVELVVYNAVLRRNKKQ